MKDDQLPATPGTKESRLAVAKERLYFWKSWERENNTPEMQEYCRSRQRHWEFEGKKISMEL
jgi:hypothetical protein